MRQRPFSLIVGDVVNVVNVSRPYHFQARDCAREDRNTFTTFTTFTEPLVRPGFWL